MTEPQKFTDLVPVEVLTAVHTAIAALEIQGPAITEALRELDRATTMAWKAVHMLGVTDEEWELVKRDIGIERGWEAAYQLVSTFDLPNVQPSADDICRERFEAAEVLQAALNERHLLMAVHALDAKRRLGMHLTRRTRHTRLGARHLQRARRAAPSSACSRPCASKRAMWSSSRR